METPVSDQTIRDWSSRNYIFKHDLQRLATDIGLEIRIAHYPPYCSKYNPIERRFFPHLGRACSGMLFDTLETVVSLMRRASHRQASQQPSRSFADLMKLDESRLKK